MVRAGRHYFLPLVGSLFYRSGASQQDLCPTTCIASGPDPANWTTVGEFGQLQACKKPLVLDFSIAIPVTEKQPIRACNVFADDFYTGPVEPPASGGTEDIAPIMAWTPAGSEDETGGLVASQPVEHLQSYLRNVVSRAANRTILFATASDFTVGVYVGANLLNPSVAGIFFDYFLAVLFGPGIADDKAALIQACDGRGGGQIFGLIAASTPDFTTVHGAVARWSNGQCVDTSSYPETFDVDPEPIDVVGPDTALTLSSSARVGLSNSADSSNATSPAVRGLLLARAGCRTIDVKGGGDCGKLVTRYGGGLTVAQFYQYNTKSNLCATLQPGQHVCCTPDGDFCAKVAAANGLTVDELEKLNKETWGWLENGCENGFWPDNWICLSEGTPPFPAPIANGVYGPQKLGSTKPNGLTSRDWAKVNQCPLNSCCNIEDKLTKFQFQQFKKLRGPKHIISFNGWVFSAEAPFYHIFRNDVKAENRNKLADNLVKYVVDNGLDGLDINWKYPSAPNLGKGVPESDPSEAMDYLPLLSLLRSKLPKDKSLSIAAPAFHWYLKQFPIKAMAELLDYIVYITYDLYGQWDAGNKVMITKAGVPSNKVLVGVGGYGRSFRMANPSCTGPNCLYTGDRLTSYARKGRCTDTAGYMSNAEIAEIKGRSWLDAESNLRIMVDGDLWVAYMDDSLKESRTQTYKGYNMGGTIDWAVDLVKFHDLPNLLPDGTNLGLTWALIKANVRMGESATCNPADALDCKSGLDDIIRRWQDCDYKQPGVQAFDEEIASYLHAPSRPILRNYYYSLESTGDSLAPQKDTFIETFAPKPDDDSKIFDLLLTLMPIPLTAAVPRSFGGALASMKYFSGVTGGNRRAASEAGTITMEIAFNGIFDKIITKWKEQVNQLVAKIFNGEPENVKLLNALVSDGKMIQGKEDQPADGYTSNYTKSWEDSKYIERAFYALAIPVLWAADRPTPVILDFGNSCVINATKYFEGRADKYNAGWRCPNGHSYILAGVDDTPKGCPYANPRAVNTYNKNKGKNVMDPAKSMTDPTDIRRFRNVAGRDIRLGGFQHIPICGPEEARANLLKGHKAYGDSPNYPCNP
ncbi:hypothetical protein DL766_006995 [Monosporascus sp. MC13-8B]|nr:hypothetical protein DL763_008048 [Monosporascus cannonballus]RYP25599.1 hypothetical protein DL766_006995 [Monosporascus sp. MC13-8B]